MKDYININAKENLEYFKSNFVDVENIDIWYDESEIIQPIPLDIVNLYINNANIFFNELKEYHDKYIKKYDIDKYIWLLSKSFYLHSFDYCNTEDWYKYLFWINFAYPEKNYFEGSYHDHSKLENMTYITIVFNTNKSILYSLDLDGNLVNNEYNKNKFAEYKQEIKDYFHKEKPFLPIDYDLTIIDFITEDDNYNNIFEKIFKYLEMCEIFNLKLPLYKI